MLAPRSKRDLFIELSRLGSLLFISNNFEYLIITITQLCPRREFTLCGHRSWQQVQSEVQLETELNVSGVACACDNAEGCVRLNIARRKTSRRRARVSRKGRGGSGIGILRVIQEIENLRPELKVYPFRKAEVFENGDVPVVNTRTAHNSTAGRTITEEGRREGGSVEPLR